MDSTTERELLEDAEEMVCTASVTVSEETIPIESFDSNMDLSDQILAPDNPLLEKFQRTLKEHLLKQIESLKSEIYDYDLEIKDKTTKKESLGVKIYETQQIVAKQQITLENCTKQLETVKAAKEEINIELEEKRTIYRSERDRLLESEKNELQLRKELESTNLLIQQVSQWEKELESDLTIKQRISEKTKKDKEKLLEEKRMLDMLIYNLMRRIWSLENDLETMDLILKIKEEERTELAEHVALGNTNIEAIQSEYRALFHSWNSVVVAISNRDKVLTCLGTELGKMTEKFKSTITEIEQVKKLSRKEMEKNEQLTLNKTRLKMDIDNCKAKLDEQTDKKDRIQREMMDIQSVLDQIHYDLNGINEENQNYENHISSLMKEIEKLDNQKAILEENILAKLEDQITNDKASLHLNKLAREFKDKNYDMEITLASIENKNAQTLMEEEIQRLNNKENQQVLDEIERQVKDLEKQADDFEEDIKKSMFLINKKQREMDVLSDQLQKLIEKQGGPAVTNIEERINSMEKTKDQLQDKNKELQKYWLREQKNLLILSQQRQEQIYNNNLMRKQIMILEQKNLKINDALEELKKTEEKFNRRIHNLQTRLCGLEEALFKKKDYKSNLNKDNDVAQQDYLYKLKDAELECLQIQMEINEIEDEKVAMTNQVFEMNREALEWEKKYKLAKDARDGMLEDRREGSELALMRSEIHRMTVRYDQLKRAQEKLIQDLEMCINRREYIIEGADNREKRTKNGIDKTKVNFQRKLDDMRNKIKQMINETEVIKLRIDECEKEKAEIQMEIARLQEEFTNAQAYLKNLCKELEEIKTKRLMNLELLSQIERKLAMYNEITKGRKPYTIYRTESALTSEYQRQKDLNNRLATVIENLITDFPPHSMELTRILNSLKLPAYVMYT